LTIVAVAMAVVSCGGSNGSPGTPTPPPPTGTTTVGRVVDAITDGGAGNVAISGPGIAGTASDSTGAFVVSAVSGGMQSVALTGSTFVARQTSVRVPGPSAVISLIPSSFELGAFNEMFRVEQLLRWTQPPPLLVQRRVLPFTGLTDTDFTAGAEEMTEAEYASLVGDLQWTLPQLTGGQFTAFAKVTSETAAAGAHVHTLNDGVITVARFTGLTAATGFGGYSRWQYRADGTIIGGSTMLDRDFDRSNSSFRRGLRAHELGHALGYNHVTLRPSVMNGAARLEPNDFDRSASRIAFQRPPGNRSPDVDPTSFSTNRVGLRATWSPPIP
jgi:hypothetical protein